MLHEWRAAIGSVKRRRGLAVAIVLTLTPGIGANSAINENDKWKIVKAFAGLSRLRPEPSR